ncbi:MAG: hypothetical protein FD187_673 [bacterium]|nr:MAG: hypothetical protein FD142_930 [bacterium]KAF0150083.1 MAG: hypothetical protein FD187_673 [bacterium]KAF0169191.1 MAG: hypothetical protein FD158_743 [bacterium]TXT19101.1 MAG: hypothetical protein FD132_1866 [bacterium]
MDPYEESPIEFHSYRDSVNQRPGLYFGDLEDGTAYALIVEELVSAVLWWKTGANLSLTLEPELIELACRAELPGGAAPATWPGFRPLFVFGKGMASLAFTRFTNPLHMLAAACRQSMWELRDRHGEESALFDEGRCRMAAFVAPELPREFCFRASLRIGTERLTFAPASLEQVARRIRYQDGPQAAAYWGCVTVRDMESEETRVVIVTEPPHLPRANWRPA